MFPFFFESRFIALRLKRKWSRSIRFIKYMKKFDSKIIYTVQYSFQNLSLKYNLDNESLPKRSG